LLNIFFESFNQAIRMFEYDYIFIDGVFLAIWLGVLIKYKKWAPIKFGIITGFLIYTIDAIAWFNIPAGSNYPTGTFIREYWIGGIYMPRPLGDYFWIKAGADFMMTFSYSMFAFTWLWIIFENFIKKNIKEIALFTALFIGFWILTPFLSLWLPINNTIVESVRYMDSQQVIWFVNIVVGYSLLFLIYGTKKFGSKKPKIILYVFFIGCVEAFFMEFPLLISGIRPTGVFYLLFSTVIMFNQGAPYLYILYDMVIPRLSRKVKKDQLKEIEIVIERKK